MRSESVRLALRRGRPVQTVLVHDAARPLLTAALAERGARGASAAMRTLDAAIAAAPVTDTVKRVDADGPWCVETLDRSALWAVQTPQVFRRAALERALDVAAEVLAQATDDAWLVERPEAAWRSCRRRRENLKVTTPLDLRAGGAAAAPSGRPGPPMPD